MSQELGKVWWQQLGKELEQEKAIRKVFSMYKLFLIGKGPFENVSWSKDEGEYRLQVLDGLWHEQYIANCPVCR